jgi:hypothetical protein
MIDAARTKSAATNTFCPDKYREAAGEKNVSETALVTAAV